jgi:hypothetical protein
MSHVFMGEPDKTVLLLGETEMLRKAGMAVAALVAAVTGVVLVTAPASGAPATTTSQAAYCGIDWGSGTKSGPASHGAPMVGLRAGQHDCYDRLVFDLSGPVGGYHVSYVDEMTEDASGNPVPLRGGGKLSVTVHSPAYDTSSEPWESTYVYTNRAELVDVTGYRTFRQVAWAGSWEGSTSVGLGVRARLPFRVFTVGDRVVVDVAHLW